MRKYSPSSLFYFAFTIVVLFFATAAHAHKVNMFAYVEEGAVYVEGYFTDGKRAKNSEVKAFDKDDKEIASGTTDDEGAFIFKNTISGNLRITLNAGMGHKTEYVLDTVSGEGEVTLEDIASDDMDKPQSESNTNSSVAAIDDAAIAKIVRKAVMEANKPLVRSLNEMKERRGLSDIIGGIGIIIGLLGGFLYFKSRQTVSADKK